MNETIAEGGTTSLFFVDSPVTSVGLVLRNEDGHDEPWCTATLVACDVALTARHCLFDSSDKRIPDSNFSIFFPDGGHFGVVHAESAKGDSLAHDVAVLYLNGQPDVPHVTLDTKKHISGDGLIVGMGDGAPTAQDRHPDSGLRRSAAVSYEACDSGWGYCWSYEGTPVWSLLVETLTEPKLDEGTTCAGDSGGPLFAGGRQIGVHSNGSTSKCGHADHAVDASLNDIKELASWLNGRQACDPLPFDTWAEASDEPEDFTVKLTADLHDFRVAVDTSNSQPPPTVRVLDPNHQTLCEFAGSDIWAYCSVKTDGAGDYAIDITGAPVWTQVTFGVR